MPSHNGCDLGINTAMDITELSFSDNLLNGNGVIKATEKKIADIYKTDYALMLTCGATMGVSIAVNTAKLYGDIIAVVGDAHISVYNSARVQNMQVVNVASTSELLDIKGKIGAIFITSPNYYGVVTVADNWRYKDALLIIDESHGSHFPFSKLLPDSQRHKCDILISSWHKGLPVLTGGAVMVCSNEKIYRQLLYSRKLLHSTSPNYMIMASMDRACDEMSANGGKYYDNVFKEIKTFKANLCERYYVIDNDDATRLCISLKGKDASGFSKILETNGIYIEATYNDILVLIVTPYNYKWLKQLLKVMNNVEYNEICKTIIPPKCEKAVIKSNKVDFIDIKDALGRICALDLGIYPPGVPLIVVGDIINNNVIDFIVGNKQSIFGLVDGLIAVVGN